MFRAVKLLCDTSPSVNPTRAEDLGDDDASVQVRRLQHRCPREGSPVVGEAVHGRM